MAELGLYGRFYPTTLRLPMWARGLSLGSAIRTFGVSEPRVRVISPIFVKEAGLMRSLYKPDLRPVLDPRDIFETVKAEWPVDGTDVVEWMQISTVEMAVLQARLAEYNRLGSQAVGNSNDPRYPGLVVEDCKIKDDWGADVKKRGYGIAVTPKGSYNIPYPGKTTGCYNDLISWGSASYASLVGCQWTATLIKWRSLAETPIRQTVGFYMDKAGNTAPNFFVQQPTRPALTVTVRQRISSDKDQTLEINFRDPTNYANVMGSKSVAVAKGENEVVYSLSAFPYVPPTVAELQPQNATSTKLEEYTVA